MGLLLEKYGKFLYFMLQKIRVKISCILISMTNLIVGIGKQAGGGWVLVYVRTGTITKRREDLEK
jgi:hypothetical protein